MVGFALALFLLVVNVVLIAALVFLLVSLIRSQIAGAPYVPIERRAMRDILKFGAIGPGDVVFDFGSGDGRVLIDAVRHFGASGALGYEISWWPYLKSKFLIKKNGLRDRIRVERKNMFGIPDAVFSEVTVFYVYTSPETMKKLAESEFLKMKNGTKIISPSFRIPEESGHFRLVDSTDIGWHRIFLYEKI